MASDKPQGRPISNIFADIKSAAKSAITSTKRGISKIMAKKKKKKKKVDYSKRVDIYAQGQKRKKKMEAAGKY